MISQKAKMKRGWACYKRANTTINWDKYAVSNIGWKQFNDMVLEHEYVYTTTPITRITARCEGTYFVIREFVSRTPIINLIDEKCTFRRFRIHQRVMEDDSCDEYNGLNALIEMRKLFKQYYNTTFESAFGIDKTHTLKRCVPSPINWAESSMCGTTINKVYKADVSAAYGYESSKTLPTLAGCKRVHGVVEPTEEFPFAFYPDTYSVSLWENGKIFRGYDIVNCSRYYKYYTKGPNNASYTILCRASKYTLAALMEENYNLRNVDPHAKQRINFLIGMFQKNKNPTFAHISAVVNLRCSIRMILYAESVCCQGGYPLLIATDSIAYCSNRKLITTYNKQLGALVEELNDAQMYIHGPKSYQYRDNPRAAIHTICSGLENGPIKQNLSWGGIDQVIPKAIAFDYAKGIFYPTTNINI